MIQKGIESGKPEVIDNAVKSIKETFGKSHDDAYMCVKFIDNYWQGPLAKKGRHAEIAELCKMGIVARFNDVKQLEMLLKHRIRALRVLKKHDERGSSLVPLTMVKPEFAMKVGRSYMARIILNTFVSGITSYKNTWTQALAKFTNGARGLDEKVEVGW